MSGQYFPSRFEAPAARRAEVPVFTRAAAPRKLAAAFLDLLVVVAPLCWGLYELRRDHTVGWVGVGLAGATAAGAVVLPWLAARTTFMAALGLQMIDVETGRPVRGPRTLLRHVWPPARGEVCDVRTIDGRDSGARPSDSIVPPLGPTALRPDELSGALISDVPRGSAPLLRPEPTGAAFDDGTIARPVGRPSSGGTLPPQCRLTFETGLVVDVVGVVMLGRDPIDPQGGRATLVRIDDPGRSLSKTHARVILGAGGAAIEDLGSTNGVVVVRGGIDREVVPGRAFPILHDDEIFLGQLRAHVSTTGGAS